MKTTVSMAALLVVAAGASAQVTPIGPFTGAESENFATVGQWPPNGPCTFCVSIDMFPSALATVSSPQGGANMHVTGGWGFQCSMQARPGSPRLFASTGGGGVNWDFAAGMEPGRFGGYFGHFNPGAGDATVNFFDTNGQQVGSEVIALAPASCTWNWYGWEFSVAIGRIQVVSNYSGGGYIAHDDMEWDPFTGGPCYPDCDTSTGPGVLDIFDFLCFGNRFSSGDPYACDCDTSTGPGVCDIFDFLCFGNEFNAGCP